MRIVIDLQGAQTISRFRGIGRYSMALAQAIVRNAGDHEIWLVLNAALAESLASIRSAFAGLIPKQRIRVFEVPAPVAQNESENAWRARSAEKIREHFIQELHPDVVLVTSLFEGYLDDGVTSVGAFCSGTHTAVILYDLIPLLNPDTYLPTQLQKQYYERKIQSLGNAGLLLSISNYSRQEAIDALQLEPGKVVCISSAVEPHFKPEKLAPDEAEVLYRRFGISRRMVLCAPGGFDARKNIEGLIQAYGLLPADLRANHQLVLASRLTEAEQRHLYELAQESHLAPDELVITGYVTNADLVALYSMATLFVYPSKHEGFGLPALEAMACGAPVIGSNCTSVPEVIDFPVALFDPFSAQAIADKLFEVLTNRDMLNRLREHGLIQAAKFSWDVSAHRALRAMEAYVAATKKQAVVPAQIKDNKRKLRLAFVSPLPPEKTGIANYSLELLPALAEHYEIELVCDQAQIALPPSLYSLTQRTAGWFAANGDCYDRIIYQFGNSPFHSHMLALLRQHPGVVTLHDFFLSGLLAYEEVSGNTPGAWTQALFHSHGYAAVLARCNSDLDDVKNAYPCNLEILQNAVGIIVHSPYSQALSLIHI